MKTTVYVVFVVKKDSRGRLMKAEVFLTRSGAEFYLKTEVTEEGELGRIIDVPVELDFNL